MVNGVEVSCSVFTYIPHNMYMYYKQSTVAVHDDGDDDDGVADFVRITSMDSELVR